MSGFDDIIRAYDTIFTRSLTVLLPPGYSFMLHSTLSLATLHSFTYRTLSLVDLSQL